MPEKHAWARWFWLTMGACALAQLVLAGSTAGYEADYNTFWAWALRAAEQGFSEFYAEGYFADYPPGGILLLWPLGKLAQLLHVSHTSAFARCLLAVPGILAGTGLAALCYRLAGPGRARGFLLGAAAGASPALLYVTGVWKQMDMVYLFFLVACFAALEKRRTLAAALCWGAALALKPQALILGPVLAVCVLAHAWFHPRRHAALFRAAGAGAAALVPALVCGLAFLRLFRAACGAVGKNIFPPRKATPTPALVRQTGFPCWALTGPRRKTACCFSLMRNGVCCTLPCSQRGCACLPFARQGRGGCAPCCWPQLMRRVFSALPTACTSVTC